MQKEWGMAVVGLVLAAVIPAADAAGPLWSHAQDAARRSGYSQGSVAGAGTSETSIAVTLSGPAQYSDRLLITVSLTLPDGSPVGGAPVQFALGAVQIGVAVTDAQGSATLDWLVKLPAGAYQLEATYAGDQAANLAPSASRSDLTVIPEVALIRWVAPNPVPTADGSTLTLTATVAEEADAFYGKLDGARVSFRVLDQTQRVVARAVTPVVATGDGTGTASASLPMLPEGRYTVETEVQSGGLHAAAHKASPMLIDGGKRLVTGPE